MRKFPIALLFLLGIMFLIGSKAELTSTFQTLQLGNWRYLAAAMVMQILWVLGLTGIFRLIYKAMGIHEKFYSLLFLVGAANFITIVTPSAGVSGLAVFVAEAHRRHYSPARAAVAGAVFMLFDYIGFFFILCLGLLVLFRRQNLTWVEISATSILMVVMSTLALLMFLGLRSGNALASVLSWLARFVNRLLRRWLHRDYLSVERAIAFAHDAASGLAELKRHPSDVLVAIGLAAFNKILLITVLALCFMSFHVVFSPGTLIAAFSIGYLFMTISPTPAGLGFFEGSLTLVLTSMNIPLGIAALVTITYRAITFWLVLLFGMFSLRMLERTGDFPGIEENQILGE